MSRLAFLLVVLQATTGAALGAGDRAKQVNVFGPGEQTTYAVSYLGIVAGRAQLTVGSAMEQFGHQVWPLVCDGETTALGSLFPVKDRFVSYWDPVGGRPLGADFFVHENRYRSKERYTYDFEGGQALVVRKTEGKPPSERRFDIQPETLDLAAAGFRLRNADLTPGTVHQLPIFTGVKLYLMKATVVGREMLSTALGELEVYRVTVNGDFGGKLATEGLMTLFYTADQKQLPVRAEASFLFGTVRVEAIHYEPGQRWAQDQ